MVVRVTPGQLGMATPFGELQGLTNAELYAELADYASMGVDWIRTDIHWEWVQRTATGGYNWSAFDKVFKAAESYGIEIVASFSDPPDWVDQSFASAATKTAFTRFVAAAARHFGDTVDYWQIINEPNKKGINAENYTAVLKTSYNAIKAVDRDDVVISAGLAPVPHTGQIHRGAVDYLEGIYANGGKNYFDAVGYHPYSWPLQIKNPALYNGWEMMETQIRDIMLANGDGDKQIWMTEMGTPTAGRTNVSPALQVQNLNDAVQLAKGYDWAGPIMWYSYKDRGGTDYTENWFGLLTPQGQRKPAYYIYKNLALADDDDLNLAPGAKAYAITTAGVTRIADFAEGDKIDLSRLDANRTAAGDQDFTYIGFARFRKVGDVGVYKDYVNKITQIKGDTNGDGKSDFNVQVKGIHQIDASDLILGDGARLKVTITSGTQWLTDWARGTRIDLSAIDANTTSGGNQSFVHVGSTQLTRAGHLGVYPDRGGNKTDIQMDTNGDGRVDIHLLIEGIHTLNATDFVL